MYERFTDRARKVLQLAQGEACARGWSEIFPRDILRGIVKEGANLGFAVLRNLDVDTDKLLADLDLLEVDGPDPKGVRQPSQVGEPTLKLTPGAQRCVQRAVNEARNLNHDYVGSEHLLLGVISPDNPEIKVLNRHGVTLEKAREEILNLLGHKVKDVIPEPTLSLLKTYAHHTPDDRALSHIRRVRRAFSRLHEDLAMLCPQSRELSVALTNLETAAMWAIKAIVCNDPNSKVEGEVADGR